MDLYHGTTSDRVDSILDQGLEDGSLTDEKSTALRYAKATAGMEGSEPAVVRVEVDDENLQRDGMHEEDDIGGGGYVTDGAIPAERIEPVDPPE